MATAKKTARVLLSANLKDSVSWRQISKYGLREDDVQIQSGIAPGTLCRFAKAKGTWQPKDIKIQKLLGIYCPKYPRWKYIQEMSRKELFWCLNNRQPMA